MKFNYGSPRSTGRAIVVKDGQILLMERWRGDLHYFSIPGGGIEAGEDAETAAVRELKEETGVDIALERKVYVMKDGPIEHHIFLARWISGEPHLPPESEEAQAGPDNRYLPRWIDANDLAELHLGYWQPLREQLARDAVRGFSGAVKITAV